MIMMATGGRQRRCWLSGSPELRASAVRPEPRKGGGGSGKKSACIFESLFSLEIYLEVGLLDHIISIFSFF